MDPRTVRTRVLALPLAALAVVGLAACGGGRSAERAAYAQCMSQHGVTLPDRDHRPSTAPGAPRRDPNTAPPGVDQNAWTTARAACAAQAPKHPADSGG